MAEPLRPFGRPASQVTMIGLTNPFLEWRLMTNSRARGLHDPITLDHKGEVLVPCGGLNVGENSSPPGAMLRPAACDAA